MQSYFYFFVESWFYGHTKFGDFMNYNTDLAREQLEHLKENEDYKFNKLTFNDVTLEQYDFFQEPKGHYDEIILNDYQQDDLLEAFKVVMTPYLPAQRILVVGLGNADFNADAIGPKIVGKMEMNLDHLYLFIPRVKGQTGLESAEMVKSIVEKYQIDLVIAIDSLSAIQSDALYKTIQINDIGIRPGSGVGNYTTAINEAYLGCKVIAVGIPCVIKVSNLINEFFKYVEGFFSENLQGGQNILKVVRKDPYQGELDDEKKQFLMGHLGTLHHDERYHLIEEIMNPINKNYVITSKDIDYRIEILSNMISICLMNILN